MSSFTCRRSVGSSPITRSEKCLLCPYVALWESKRRRGEAFPIGRNQTMKLHGTDNKPMWENTLRDLQAFADETGTFVIILPKTGVLFARECTFRRRRRGLCESLLARRTHRHRKERSRYRRLSRGKQRDSKREACFASLLLGIMVGRPRRNRSAGCYGATWRKPIQ
jgi:hypothetical protein